MAETALKLDEIDRKKRTVILSQFHCIRRPVRLSKCTELTGKYFYLH